MVFKADKYLYLPITIPELIEGCIANAPITADARLKPGVWMRSVPEDKVGIIDAEFGIEKLDYKTAEVVARCGFDLMGERMVIGHTPQGFFKGFLSSQARHRLVRSPFRSELMSHMIHLAVSLGVTTITGKTAESHHKVISGSLTYEEGYRRMDALYNEFGFKRIDDGLYSLDLTQEVA